MDLYATNGKLLYTSRQPSMKRALAEAAQVQADLSGIDLRRARLRETSLDGLYAPSACLWGADLSGADLSGADLAGACLRGADTRMATLSDCCLADADCTNARFEGAFFRQTLIEGVDFSFCAFSCPSILQQNLQACASLHGAVYWHRGEEACSLDCGSTRLVTGNHMIIVLGQRLIANGELLPIQKGFSQP